MPLLGSETPRIFTPPLRELTPETSLGFEVIWFAENVLGLVLFPWQRWLLIHALEWHPTEPRLRFRKVLVLVARQNGKTWLSVILGLYFLFVLRVRLVLGSAQNLDMAEETWEAAVDLVMELDDDEQPVRPDLAAEVAKVARTNGMKALVLSAARVKPSWKVKSITNAGRGKTTALLFLDELREHKTWQGWAALTKTTNAVPDALIWCMTNAGEAGSVVLRHLRRLAHLALGDPDGEFGDEVAEAVDDEFATGDDLAIFEWSAAPGRGKWDREGWCEANPSLGHGTITEHAIASDARIDPWHVFQAEVLCRETLTSTVGPFPGTSWTDTLDPESEIPDGADVVYALELSEDRMWASLHAAGYRSDGLVHGEVIAHSPGQVWVPAWFADRADQKFRVAVEKDSPAWSLVEALPSNVTVVEVAGADRGLACGGFYDLVVGEEAAPARYRHRPQAALDVAAAVAKMKPLGPQWIFNRRNDDDVTPLLGQVWACWLLERAPKPKVSAYAARGVMTV